MKKTKLFAAIGGMGLAIAAIVFIAADHVDAPAVAGTKTDIADLYAFEGDNPDNTVFVATVQGPLAAGSATTGATFDEDVMIQFNIDNTGDFIEDVVIQAVKRGDSMYFFGPHNVTAGQTGLTSQVFTSATRTAVKVSTSSDVQTANNGGIQVYAGPRRDPFFFDFNRFNMVVAGAVAPEGFLPPGQASDFFEDLNVLAAVVEVPNSLLGDAPAHVAGAVGINGLPNAYNVWVTTKRKNN
ncbi:hypothetical protein ULMS_14190 [Patiriisocius marinistellae]|uniref:Molecular chaperone DnaK n=1 Tax=Patiriisocius marinistellae TaxID=2494560 RepID=A0A5J4G1M1_9FLAO|nr:DUF4331 family protein [Patiriisocius marinistellae]GEQ85911.1 hypothetical protein ULMS_14190 [Patiriisocius marinistellae]